MVAPFSNEKVNKVKEVRKVKGKYALAESSHTFFIPFLLGFWTMRQEMGAKNDKNRCVGTIVKPYVL